MGLNDAFAVLLQYITTIYMYLSKIEKYMRKKKTFLVSIIGLSRFHVVDRILGKKWKMA